MKIVMDKNESWFVTAAAEPIEFCNKNTWGSRSASFITSQIVVVESKDFTDRMWECQVLNHCLSVFYARGLRPLSV
jgi:hypothetical protein